MLNASATAGGQHRSPPPAYTTASHPAHDGVRCFCGAPMVRRRSVVVDHPGRPRPDYWGCVAHGCDGSVGAHADGRPLGTPTDRKGRAARRAAHVVLDRLWIGHHFGLTRYDAYGLVQYVMDLPEERAHIALFDPAQCRQLIDALVGLFPELERPELEHPEPTPTEGRTPC